MTPFQETVSQNADVVSSLNTRILTLFQETLSQNADVASSFNTKTMTPFQEIIICRSREYRNLHISM